MNCETPLYPHSESEAKKRKELTEWRESFNANAACKKAIEDAIRRNFDGTHLKASCAQSVIDEYGYKRVRFVLTNTLREKSGDGRFSRINQSWGSHVAVPAGRERSYLFVADRPSALLDGFIDQYWKAYHALGMFGNTQCEPDSGDLDFTNRVLVLSPEILKESCWQPENQLWYAHSGFGCKPHSNGRAVFCTSLGDGEKTRWNRLDFLGVLNEEFLPDWAQEKLAELRGTEPEIAKTEPDIASAPPEMKM